MTQLLLIRHAVNDYVKTQRLAGWTPGVHLNDEGRAQAAALGERLAKARIDAIYASPLERTVETAQAIIAHHPGLTLQLLEEVGEVRYGDWTGEEIRKLAQRKMWRVIQINPSRAYFPNGEAMRDVQIRAVNAIEKLIQKHPRQTVAVVSHSDVIKMILTHYLGMHLDQFQRLEISPASLSVIAMGAGRPTVVQINESHYLPPPPKHVHKAFAEAYEAKRAATSITVDAVGQPGSRTFYLQAAHGQGEVVSILIEKTQAMQIADQVEDLFRALAAQYPALNPLQSGEPPILQNPEAPLFRAGKFGLQYNAENDLVDVEIVELRPEGQGEPDVLHLWVSRSQLGVMAEHARHVARSGAATHS
jgi:probable phosphoglycerate mutase